MTDLEIDIINKNREIFEQKDLVLCIPSRETLKIARDKYSLYKAFKDDEKVLSIPTFSSDDDLQMLTYPCVAKPRGEEVVKDFIIYKTHLNWKILKIKVTICFSKNKWKYLYS